MNEKRIHEDLAAAAKTSAGLVALAKGAKGSTPKLTALLDEIEKVLVRLRNAKRQAYVARQWIDRKPKLAAEKKAAKKAPAKKVAKRTTKKAREKKALGERVAAKAVEAAEKTAKSRKAAKGAIHWETRPGGGKIEVLCNAGHDATKLTEAGKATTDKAKVTCKRCLGVLGSGRKK